MLDKKAVWTIAKKDVYALRASVQLWLPMLVVPVLFGIVFPGVLLTWARLADLSAMSSLGKLVQMLQSISNSSGKPDFGSMPSENHQLVYFLSLYLFAPLFLLIPIMSSSIITANSFAGEKERKTLEGLLYTPITMKELFLGKILAAFVPSLLLTAGAIIMYGIIVDVVAYPMFGRLIFPNASWILLMLVVVPAVSLFVILINVLISAKVKGFQEAYQLGGLAVLPVLGLVVSQATGMLLLSPLALLVIGALLLIVDVCLVQLLAKYKRHAFLDHHV
ncbi:ABC transporter permease subunit [Paenibacillus caui]|uniref:ABC transporter permease subunit n=1 Tax=Paenibacillus caui TaxID=2873927 RepID=UPI001CAA0AAC|nr:ABC transporter permease subunit [Paenibacillus caui]